MIEKNFDRERLIDVQELSGASGNAHNLTKLFDDRGWGGYQKLVLLLCCLAILLDGFDNQALGFALPAILREWGLEKAALAPALAVSQVGMMIGAIGGGFLGDRIGRKASLIASVVIFGSATLAVALVHSVSVLVILRLIAGVGLGAAFPNVAALVSEFTPTSRRGLAVTIGIVCVPLGGTLGGLLASAVLPAFGWRALFVVAGVAPLALALLLLVALPESVRFLARKGGNGAQIARTLKRVGTEVTADAVFFEPEERLAGAAGHILTREYRRDTLALWCAFFFCLSSIYAAFGWLPTLLTESGLSLATASQGLAAFNLGGVVTALVAGALIGRFGSRGTMIFMALSSFVAAGLIALFPLNAHISAPLLFVALFVEGGFVNGVQTTLYALAAHVYPTSMRSTGVGTATGIGRGGAISSSALGAAVIALGGASAFHGLIAVNMIVVTIALFLIRRHQTV